MFKILVSITLIVMSLENLTLAIEAAYPKCLISALILVLQAPMFEHIKPTLLP